MNILHIISGELSEGAAIGAVNLHKALLDKSIDSHVASNASYHSNLIGFHEVRGNKVWIKLLNILESMRLKRYYRRSRIIFSSGNIGIDITKLECYKEADIIHFHWITGIVNLKVISKIKKPIIWSIRDTWAFTGGCHVAQYFDCERYRTGCGACLQLRSANEGDLSSTNIKQKLSLYRNDMVIVGISEWITKAASEALVFQGNKISCIKNIIDTNVYRPLDKLKIRAEIGIPQGMKVISYGMSNYLDKYKRADLFYECLRELSADEYVLVTFGKNSHLYNENCHLQTVDFGFQHNQEVVCKIYNAADLFVSTSSAESFGKTVAEAMACGTPVICSDIPGLNEVVDHGENGFLFEGSDPLKLAQMIEHFFASSQNDRFVLSSNARHKVSQNYSPDIIAEQYIEQYNKMLSLEV